MENTQSPRRLNGIAAIAAMAIAAAIIIIAVVFVLNRAQRNKEISVSPDQQAATAPVGSADILEEPAAPADISSDQENDLEVTSEQTRPPELKTFTVSGKNFSLSPAQITVNKGNRVKIVFQNGQGFHDWVIDEFSARTSRIGAGESAEVEFIAERAGNFEYYCSVGDHRQQGMRGTLIVE